jgi:tRNA G26 N,N-dimethylase Trm1
MTESQRIVMRWRIKLLAMGWHDDAISEIIKGLCEAGYRRCIEEIQERAAKTDAIIAKVEKN